MAFTAANYLHENIDPTSDDLCMNITDMEILAPVILEPSAERKPQHLRISASLAQGQVRIHFSDRAVTDSASILYAKCTVVWHDTAKVLRQWSRCRHLVCSRIDHLEAKKCVHKMHRRMVYKLFGAVVDYAERFHGMDQVLIDSECYEATAQISFKADETAGNFFRSPYWIDSLMQLSGFVMNVNEAVDTNEMVYISNGWESMQIACQLSSRKVYTAYVKMQPSQNTVYSGDMYILDEGEVVCVTMGIKFQSVPRQLLKHLLAPPPKQSLTGSMLKAADTNSGTKGIFPAHNDSFAHPARAPSSQFSGRRRCPPISSDNTDLTSKDSPDGIEILPSSKGRELSHLVLNVLGEELGMEVQDLEKNATFAEIGVDSLMSLTVVGRLRESFCLDLPSTIFQNHATVVRLVKFLEGECKGGIHGEDSEPPTTAQDFVGFRSSNGHGSVFEPPINATNRHRATSVMLQGDIRAAVSNMFLFPGGFGSSSSFAPMPHVDKHLAVFGLNSAFVNAPEDFTVSIPKLASLYLAEIRRRQPHGPYLLLGYSVGGIVAYEATRQLIMAGEVVERLYLVDSPCPLVIPPMPPKLIKFLDSIDRFGGNQRETEPPAEAVKPMGSLHVTQTLTSLESYVPEPLPDGALSPRTTYYVAKHGVARQTTVERPEVSSERDRKVMTWLLDDRKGLGGTGDGWETLVDRAKLTIFPVEGNHFSIMREPYVSRVHPSHRLKTAHGLLVSIDHSLGR